MERWGDRLAFYHYRRHLVTRPRLLDPDLVVHLTGEGIELDPSWRAPTGQSIRVSAAREGDRVTFRDRSSDEILFVVRLVGDEEVEVDREWAAAERAERERFWETWARLLKDLKLEGARPEDEGKWLAALFRQFGPFGTVHEHKLSYDPLYPLPTGVRTEDEMVEYLWRVARGEKSVRNCGAKCREALEIALFTREARLAAVAQTQARRTVEVDEQVFALVETLAQVRPGQRRDILLRRLLALAQAEA